MTLGLSGYALSGLSLALLGAVGFSSCQHRQIERLEKSVATVTVERDSARSQVESQAKQMRISETVREGYASQLNKLDGLARTVGKLATAVSVCGQQAVYPAPTVPESTPGVDDPGSGEQPREAELVLQELAAEFAERADRTAEQLNALISWLELTRAQ